MTMAEKTPPDLAILKAHGQAPGSRGRRDGADGPVRAARGPDDDGLVGGRRDLRDARARSARG